MFGNIFSTPSLVLVAYHRLKMFTPRRVFFSSHSSQVSSTRKCKAIRPRVLGKFGVRRCQVWHRQTGCWKPTELPALTFVWPTIDWVTLGKSAQQRQQCTLHTLIIVFPLWLWLFLETDGNNRYGKCRDFINKMDCLTVSVSLQIALSDVIIKEQSYHCFKILIFHLQQPFKYPY